MGWAGPHHGLADVGEVIAQHPAEGTYALALERVDDPAYRDIHGLELSALFGVVQVSVGFDVLLWRVIRFMYGVERQVEEEGT